MSSSKGGITPSSDKEKSPLRAFLQRLRKRRIIETLAAFIGGGWLLVEVVERLLVGHYHFPELAIDLTVVSAIAALVATLIWRWFRGMEKRPGNIKVEVLLVPLIILAAVAVDLNLALQIAGIPQKTLLTGIVAFLLGVAWVVCKSLQWAAAMPESGIRAPAATSPAAGAEQASIAVLPFKDMSPQLDQEYFCEGIAEELLNALVQIEGLRVAARTSSAQFKDKAINAQAIGRKLGVRSVLEGSVRTAGGRLRITAQLINVEDGYHLFSEKYDRTAEDIFAIQDDISLAIVDKLKVKLLKGEESKLTKRHTENEEAYRLYLQGRYFWNRRHEGGMQRGLEYFQKAIVVDPGYALPYSGIADCYFSLGWFHFLAPKEAFVKCKEAALKALEMDPDLAEAHASLADTLAFFDWDPAGAEAEFKRAIALNPNYATVHHFYSLLLTAQGRFDDAIAEQMRAMELDPIQPIIRAAHSYTLWVADRRDEAVADSRALTEFDSNFWVGWLLLGVSCAEVDRFGDAEDALRKAEDLTGGTSTFALGSLGYALGLAGKRDEARSILNRLIEYRSSKYASADLIATLYWILDERDAAFEWLERAIEERAYRLCYAKYMPTLRRMDSDPRFQKILRRLRLDGLP